MNLRSFLESTRRLLHVTTKPDQDELMLMLKISLLGVAVVGALGYIIRVLFLFFNLLPAASSGAPRG